MTNKNSNKGINFIGILILFILIMVFKYIFIDLNLGSKIIIPEFEFKTINN